MGVAVGDYDNDGYPDLYVTSYGKNILYHNNGDGTFTDVTAKAGVAAGGWSVSAGFFDYDNDGKLDLFVTRYMDWDTKHSKDCGGNYHTYCPPEEFPATTNILYHNNGDGTFTDVSQRSGIAAKKGRALGVAFADYDGDGFTDIFVANDGMQQYLFHNNGNGTFTEVGLEAGAALSQDGRRLSGMGVVFQDYDNDGRPDVIVTELPREIYGVYHNDGNGSFSYRSLETGLGALSSGSSGWGVGLEDFDNDGWKDLFVAQGHVLDNVEQIDPSLHYLEPPLLALNHNGRFERADSGSTAPGAARGAAFGDLNNDGWQDVVMTTLGGHPQVFLQSRWKTALARHYAARHAQQSRWIRRPGASEWANTICHLSRQLSFRQRQTPSLRTRHGGESEGGNRLAVRDSPDIERRSRRPISRSARTGEAVIRAFTLLFLAWQLASPQAAEHMQAGIAADKQHQFDVAIREFKKTTELDPSFADGFISLGQAYMESGDYASAIAPLKQALELNSDSLPAHQLLGYCSTLPGLCDRGDSTSGASSR